MNPYRICVHLFASVLFVALAGCATSGVNEGDINVVSIEEEWQLGRQLEEDLARELDLVNDPVVLRYVNQVGNRIVRQTEMSGLPWEFHVVRNDEINAFNIPGGHVYIHTGLIEAAENSSELTGVMAHEIGHGVARHATEQLTRAYGLRAEHYCRAASWVESRNLPTNSRANSWNGRHRQILERCRTGSRRAYSVHACPGRATSTQAGFRRRRSRFSGSSQPGALSSVAADQWASRRS